MPNNLKIGVLAFQGSVEEHLQAVSRLPDVQAVPVKTLDALNQIDALIIPGGESTTIAKLLTIFGLMEPLRQRIENGMPVWGTCAGLILLAKEIEGETPHLGVMDITVRRNAYGRQIDSFTAHAIIPAMSEEPLSLVFIRAPWIAHVGEKAEVLCAIDGHIVAAKERNMLATSFHPELTGNLTVLRHFVDQMVRPACL